MSDKAAEHQHQWVWMHEWWGAHVCDCGAVQESPPGVLANTLTIARRDTVERIRAALNAETTYSMEKMLGVRFCLKENVLAILDAEAERSSGVGS